MSAYSDWKCGAITEDEYNSIAERENADTQENKMIDCKLCEHLYECQPIVCSEECEDYEEDFDKMWDRLDDIEREEYNKAFGEGE